MGGEVEPPVNVAIIGTGFGSRVQIPGFLKIEGVKIIGVMGNRYERTTQIATDFNIPHPCENYEQILNLPDLDAVSIVTPPHLHQPLTLSACSVGKHVLCEKPMALNVAEARAMLNAIRGGGLVGMIDHEFRYVPARAYAKELIDEGYLGHLYFAHISVLGGSAADSHSRPFGWLFEESKGGGFLGALGSHYIDALYYWFGGITAVSAQLHTFVKHRADAAGNLHKVTADDSFTLNGKLTNGGEALVKVSVVTRFGGGEKIELFGSDGTLVIDSDGVLWGSKVGDKHLKALTIPPRLTGGVSADDPRLRPFVTLATDFIKAVRLTKQGSSLSSEPTPSFADGLRVQQVLDAARQSSETNAWVSLPPK